MAYSYTPRNCSSYDESRNALYVGTKNAIVKIGLDHFRQAARLTLPSAAYGSATAGTVCGSFAYFGMATNSIMQVDVRNGAFTATRVYTYGSEAGSWTHLEPLLCHLDDAT